MRSDFDEFYHANYGDTVALVYGFTAELSEAQDIAQEAFCRAWQRWQQLSRYDKPVAWVRRVATNIAHSRWKRARRRARHIVRQRVEHSPGANPDHVAVVAALRKLPRAQQKALVLHHIMDMPVDEVAEQLDAPVGTVKSWLHRGRSALAADLNLNIRAEISTPPAESVAAEARRRKAAGRVRMAAMVVVLIAALAAAAHLANWLPDPDPIRPTPEPSPIPSPSIEPDDPMLGVDFFHATVQFRTFPNRHDRCIQGGPYTLAPSYGKATAQINGHPAIFNVDRPVFADLTGDGRAEAVISGRCLPANMADTEQHETLIAVLQLQADGTLREIGNLPGRPAIIEHGLVYAAVAYADPDSNIVDPGRVVVLRWDGASFVSASFDGYPGIESLDLTAIAAGLRCQGLPPRQELRLEFTAERAGAVDGDRRWSIGEAANSWIVLRGKLHYLVTLTCRRTDSVVFGPDLRLAYSPNLLLLQYDAVDGWKVVAHVKMPASEWDGPYVDGECFTVRTADEPSSVLETTPYRWNGREFEMGRCKPE